MKTRFKTLGIAIVALFAMTGMSAFAGSTASAAEFKCDVEPCTITGEKDLEHLPHLVIGTGLTISCEEDVLEGTTATRNFKQLTLKWTWGKCTSSVGSATVKFNHCDLKVTSETISEHGQIHIECAGEDKIEYVSGGCTVKIGPQTITGARYTNKESGGKRHITMTWTSPLTYTKSGLTCGFISGAAEFTGAYTLKCYRDLGVAPSGTEATTPPALKHGEQVNCEKA
jgi:hypothetical protein